MQEFILSLLFWLAMPLALIVVLALWAALIWLIWDEFLGLAMNKLKEEEDER